MALSRQQVARYAAQQLAKGVSNNTIAKLLAAYIIDTKSTRSASLLVKDIERYLAEEYGHMSLTITSAHVISSTLLKDIESIVGSYKTLEAQEIIEEDILGGVLIQTPTQEFDGTLRTKINSLRTMGN